MSDKAVVHRSFRMGSLFVLSATALACSDSTNGDPHTDAGANPPASGSGGSSIGGSAGSVAGASAFGGQLGSGGRVGGTGGSADGSGGLESVGNGGASGAQGEGGASGTAGDGGASGAAGARATGGSMGDAGSVDAASGGSGGSGEDRCDVAVYDSSKPPRGVELSGNLGTHDPALIEQNGIFYLAQTGPRVPGKTSPDLKAWSGAPSVFSSNPSWIAQQVPGATDLWAPDLSYFGGEYHLYYSASTFGSNYSCIGHATRASLSSGNWTDRGPVICSNHGSSDDWNAIDPNLIVDADGTPWLAFGSFWSGIKLIELDETGARADDDVHSIASRGGGAIEAPFIVRRCGYYYLFVSFDRCCAGADSTYNIRVGRSTNVSGPYVDKEGKAMMDGGGTLLVEGQGRWKGPGHNAVLFSGSKAFNFYHAYDTDNGGRPILRAAELAWDDSGWPISGGP